MRLIYRLLLASICVACVVSASNTAFAQLSSLEFLVGDTVATVKPDGYHDFKVIAVNNSLSDVSLNISSTQVEVPEGWNGALCAGTSCYVLTPGETYTEIVKAGEEMEIKLTLVAGSEPNTNGRVSLSLNEGFGSMPHTFDFTMSVSSASSVPVAATLNEGRLFPNPTSGHLRFDYTLPTSGDVTVKVISVDGRQMMVPFSGYQAAGNRSLDLDLSSLPAGAYLLQLESPDVRDSRVVTVAR